MNIQHSLMSREKVICNSHEYTDSTQSIEFSPSSLPCTQKYEIGAISPWDEFWIKAKEAEIVDDQGNIRLEILKKYPMRELSSEEVKAIVKILKQPIQGKNDITFTLLEYFTYLIDSAFKLCKINITSINLIGGILPSVLKSYYIRNLNEIYRKQCHELGIEFKEELVSGEVAADFNRISPDTDILTTIDKGELVQLINLGTRFFAEKLKTRGNTNQIQKDKIIKDTFYHARTVLPNFSLVSFGPENNTVDCNFVFQDNIDQSLFLHHALRLNLLDLINALRKKNSILDLPSLIPTHKLCGGWGPLLARAGKKLVCKKDPNDRAWLSYVSNKVNRFGFWDPYLDRKLCTIMISSKNGIDPFKLLKKKWEDHHFKEPLALIPLIFNALLSLLEHGHSVPRSQWKEAMRWYEAEIIYLENQQKAIPNEGRAPFFIALKNVLDDSSIPFEAIKDILQVYGCLMHSSPQPNESTMTPKGLLSNSEAIWHEVVIFQKIDHKNYAISIPFNFYEAVQNLTMMSYDRIESLRPLTLHLYPREPYKRELLPNHLISENLADQALKCLDHPHKDIKILGYDLLLIYALSTQKKWILKELIKHLPKALESVDNVNRFKLIINFEEALRGFQETIETHKIILPMINFCKMKSNNPDQLLLTFIYAMVSTNDLGLIHEANKLHITIANANLQNHIDFIKILLPLHASEAASYLLKLEKKQLISDEEEVKIFTAMSEEIRKQRKPSSQPQLHSIFDFIYPLLQSKGHLKQVCLMMSAAFMDQGLIQEAQKWFLPILKMASSNQEALFFVPQNSSFPLLSIDLPPNPIAALGILLKLPEKELELFFKIARNHPRTISTDLPILKPTFEKATLVNCADKCLKHDHPYIKCIGFELLLLYAWSFTLSTKEAEIKLLTFLLGNLPVVLSTNPEMCEMFLNGLRPILLRTFHAQIVDSYLLKLKGNFEASFKHLYLTNCNALSSTNDETLCKISKNLFSLAYMKKLAPNLDEIDQIDIAFTSILNFSTEHALLGIESLKMLEKENKAFKNLTNKPQLKNTKRTIYLDLITTLIHQNYIQIALDMLLKGIEDKVIIHDAIETTELWINLLNGALLNSDFGIKNTVELWKTMRKQGKLQKTHSHQYIDLIIKLINTLFSVQNCPFIDFIGELETALKNLNPSSEQKLRLNLIFINDLKMHPESNPKKLKLSFQRLEKIDPMWLENDKLDYLSNALIWLKSSQISESEFHKEMSQLITNVMKIISNGTYPDENIIAICKFLILILKWSLSESGLLNKDLKNLLLSNLRIADTLQRSDKAEMLLEYFYVLSRHNLLDKSSDVFFDQAIWLTDQILKYNVSDSSKLQILHKLVKGSFQQNSNIVKIDSDNTLLPCRFASALINQELYTYAKEWIEIILERQKSTVQSDYDLSEKLISWCESFLGINQFHFSQMLFSQICQYPNHASDDIKAKFCFNISKGILTKDAYTSGQLLLDYWPILNQKIDKIGLREHLKNAIDIVLTSGKSSYSIKLASSLIPLYDAKGPDFLLLQLVKFGEIITLPKEISDEDIQATEFYKAVGSTFFSIIETSIDQIEYENILDLRWELIDQLTGSTERIHVLCGITFLNELLEQLLINKPHGDSLDILMKWAVICHDVLFQWFTSTPNEIIPKFSKTLSTLIDNQFKLIERLPTSDRLEFEKSAELSQFKNCIFSSRETIESSIIHYSKIIHKFHEEKEWLDVSQLYILDNITRHFVDSGNSYWFLTIHNKLFDIFETESTECLSSFSSKVARTYLKLRINDSLNRAGIMYMIGLSLIVITDNISLEDQENVKGMLLLIENFLLCRPFLKIEWAVEKKLNDSPDCDVSQSDNKKSPFTIPDKIRLSRECFNNFFLRILENLEKKGIDKLYPDHWLSFEILVHQKINSFAIECNNNIPIVTKVELEKKDHKKISDSNSLNFEWFQTITKQAIENISILNQYKIIKKVIETLISHKDLYSSAKALNIFLQIPEKFWIENHQHIIELYINIISDLQLYPYYISKIVDTTLRIARYLKIHHASEIFPRICLSLYSKLLDESLIENIISNCLSSSNCRSAITFFSNCVECDLIDKNTKKFSFFFHAQLKALISSNIIKVDRSALSNFIIFSLQQPTANYNESWTSKAKPAIFEVISLAIDKMFINDDEMLSENLKIFFQLNSSGYFQGRSSQLIQMWKFFSHQYPGDTETFGELISDLITCLLAIIKKISCKNEKEKKERNEMKLFILTMITDNINYVVVNNECEFKKNLKTMTALVEEGYYKGKENEHLEHLRMLSKQCVSLHEKHGMTHFSSNELKALALLINKGPAAMIFEDQLLASNLLCIILGMNRQS